MHDLQQEQTPVCFVFLVLNVGAQLVLFKLLRAILVRSFFLSQIIQQLWKTGSLLRAGAPDSNCTRPERFGFM